MNFEKEFPSLKLYSFCAAHECGEAYLPEYDGDCFSSDTKVCVPEEIQQHCIDKQRHQELMEQALDKERQRVREVIDKHKKLGVMDAWLEGPMVVGGRETEQIEVSVLLKELGL